MNTFLTCFEVFAGVGCGAAVLIIVIAVALELAGKIQGIK